MHPGGIRTNIAKAARMNNSVQSLGMDPLKVRMFDKLLRTPADDAAQQILEAVQVTAALTYWSRCESR